jgi:thiamine biosynthesis lipoprotein
MDISLWRENSLINRINAHGRRDTVFAFVDSTKFFSVLFDLSRDIHHNTHGAFDPTVWPLVQCWGFGLVNRANVTEELVDSITSFIGFDDTHIDMIELYRDKYFYEETYIWKGEPRTKLDFNAIAQGYSIDLVGELLEEHGIKDYMVEIGGETLCKGVNKDSLAWKIGIEWPVDSIGKKFGAVVNLSNKAIGTSGSYRKFYEENGIKYSHAIDPRTGYPVSHSLLSASVVTDDCASADAYATAFMVMGVQETIDFLGENPQLGLDVFLIYDDGENLQTVMTDGMVDMIEEEVVDD